jgi:hypothetical protein
LEIINLANEGEEPREVKIGTRCAAEQKEALIALLREFHEIFAWSYQDMPGLDTDIVVHKIPLKPECKPVKQALRRMKPEVILKIKEEVEKQLKAGFLSTVTYSDWVANIVPVPKKDGKVRMCVDYRDLNRASPKDNFPWAACWDNKTRLGRKSRQSTILARSSRSRRPVTCWLKRRAVHWLGPPRS